MKIEEKGERRKQWQDDLMDQIFGTFARSSCSSSLLKWILRRIKKPISWNENAENLFINFWIALTCYNHCSVRQEGKIIFSSVVDVEIDALNEKKSSRFNSLHAKKPKKKRRKWCDGIGA